MTARILVVEDDDETREAVAGALRDLGYDTAVCPDARTARAHPDVDVVVTDIRMPGESGLELCADIAGNRPDLPVILMTAFGDSRAVSLALRAGASDFLAKPFSLSDLGAAVHRALERRNGRTRVHRIAEPGGMPTPPPASSHAAAAPPATADALTGADLEALERSHIERVLRDTGGNRSEAARQLGIDRVTLYRKMKRYELSH